MTSVINRNGTVYVVHWVGALKDRSYLGDVASPDAGGVGDLLPDIELDLRSETELATSFSAELSRGVRYEANRSEVVRKIISMHKRHGEVVTRVLQHKIRESAARLVDGTLDKTSLLALAIGQQYLGDQPR
jgi:hypothetical protein